MIGDVGRKRPISYPSGEGRLAIGRLLLLTVAMPMDSHRSQVCRLEVVDTGRRRRWSFEEKLRIVEESYRGHREVSATARRHDVSRSLLFRWRKAFREGRVGMAADEPSLVPAIITRDDDLDDDDSASSRLRGRMEIVTGRGGRVIVGADVDAGALTRVLEVLDRR